MYESRIEENFGQKYLVCWYSPDLRNWDEAIKRAMEKHKINDKVPILCLPKHRKEVSFEYSS